MITIIIITIVAIIIKQKKKKNAQNWLITSSKRATTRCTKNGRGEDIQTETKTETERQMKSDRGVVGSGGGEGGRALRSRGGGREERPTNATQSARRQK